MHALQTHLQSNGYVSIDQSCPLHLPEAQLLPEIQTDQKKETLHTGRTARLVIEAFGNYQRFFDTGSKEASTLVYAKTAIPFMSKIERDKSLYTIARGDNIELAKTLLEAGADPGYKHPSFFGWAFMPHYRSTSEIASEKMRELFVSHYKEVN